MSIHFSFSFYMTKKIFLFYYILIRNSIVSTWKKYKLIFNLILLFFYITFYIMVIELVRDLS